MLLMMCFVIFGALQLTRNRSDEFVRNVSSIIGMIASLDETRIVETLRELFLRARVPSRIYADVVQQTRQDWPDALEELCSSLDTPLVS